MLYIVPMSESKNEVQSKKILDLIRVKYPNYHPLLSLAEIAHDNDANLKLKAECHTTIARYTESQLKSMEVKAEVDVDFGVLSVRVISPDSAATG